MGEGGGGDVIQGEWRTTCIGYIRRLMQGPYMVTSTLYLP